MLILPPGHYQQATQPRVRSRRERTVLLVGGILTALVVAVTLFSLTSHQPKNGNGCLHFTYAMVMGGEQFNACGAQARRTCAKPPQLGGLGAAFEDRLKTACADAKMPYRTGS